MTTQSDTKVSEHSLGTYDDLSANTGVAVSIPADTQIYRFSCRDGEIFVETSPVVPDSTSSIAFFGYPNMLSNTMARYLGCVDVPDKGRLFIYV